MDGDVGQGALVGLFSPVWGLCPFVPRDVLVLVFWWGWSQGEGFYTVEGDGVFPGPVWAGCICPGLPVRCPGTCCP